MKITAYADLHLFFNKDEKSRYKLELNNIVKNIYTGDEDMIVFCGDTMHKNYSMDAIEMVEIYEFVAQLVEACRKRGILFRIIKGTSSHDAKLVETLESLYKDSKTLKCYSEASIERIVHNGKTYTFRWLPETYGDQDIVEHLRDNIFNQVVDVTFFHGSIKSFIESWDTESYEVPSFTTMPKSIIWDDETLLKSTRYFIAGGHIHNELESAGRIFYINSYTRHNFSDTNHNKGYMVFNLKDNGTWDYRRVYNQQAPKYISHDIYNLETLKPFEVEGLVKVVLYKLQTSNSRVRIRLYGIVSKESSINVGIIHRMVDNIPYIKIESKLTSVANIDNTDNTDYTSNSISLLDKVHSLYVQNYGEIDKKEIEKRITLKTDISNL